jgi:CTP:molybdopterin cytidylyltransferase MocA
MARAAATTNNELACLVLAAGGSRRLGTPKQLLRRGTRPLLAHALAAAHAAAPQSPVIVVLGALASRLRGVVRKAAPHARIVHNADWTEGLASSLKAGLAAVPPGTAALLVLLVDQPNVDARALLRLVSAWRRRPGRAAAALYLGQPGVPAILPRRYWRAIRALAGDSGARSLLRMGPVTLAAMPEAALDIDTRGDWQRLTKSAATERMPPN